MLLPGRCSLGTVGSNHSQVFYFHIIVKIPVHLAIKLWSIFGYIRLGYSEPAHDVLLYKLNNLDGGEGFSFYPFTKIIGGN